MSVKQFILSSAGLKNISLNRFNEEDDFVLIFGEKEIRMKSFFAEFISPIIQQCHQIDPTIQIINFGELLTNKISKFNEFADDLFTDEIITQLHQIASGEMIEINHDQSIKLGYLSLILGNNEFYNKLNELFPQEFTKTNISTYLNQINLCYHYSQFSTDNNLTKIIEYLSSHFYLINEYEFLKIPRQLQYLIISNTRLKVESEDLLFDIISKIINQPKDEKNNEIDDISFLEQIQFKFLSEEKLRFFLNDFDINEMTNLLWRQLFQCFFDRSDFSNRHVLKHHFIEYDPRKNNAFDGILTWLGQGKATNALQNGNVSITASSVFDQGDDLQPPNVLNYEDDELIFQSNGNSNSWLCIEFMNHKVKPTHYSIKSYQNGGKGKYNPQSWDIEGSDDNMNWEVLDSRRNDKSLDDAAVSNTFEITNDINKIKFYRYLRIVQKEENTGNENSLVFSSIELFGYIEKNVNK